MKSLGEAFDTLTAEFTALPQIANSREKAALALEIAGGYSREELVLKRDAPLADEVIARLEGVLATVKTGAPLAYALGEWYFAARRFFVTSDVLIPRPDTETLLSVALKHAIGKPRGLRVLEIGVGSGAVIISLFCELAGMQPVCVGTDVSQAALAVTERNALAHGCLVGLREGSIFGPIAGSERYDIIISNPPYVPACEEVEDGVRDYEPELAYRVPSGLEGTHFHSLIANGAREHLNSGGVLAMEVGAGQAKDVARMMSALEYMEVKTTNDLGGICRVVEGVWRG